MGTVSTSEALHARLYSQDGNFTVAMPSCSLMDITTPTLPSTPLPTTWERRGRGWGGERIVGNVVLHCSSHT